jgi:hypothetical protein
VNPITSNSKCPSRANSAIDCYSVSVGDDVFEIDASHMRPLLGARAKQNEIAVLGFFLLVDVVNGSRILRQVLFHGNHVQLGRKSARHFNGSIQRPLRSI